MPGTRKAHGPFVFRCDQCGWEIVLRGRETATSAKLCVRCGGGWMQLVDERPTTALTDAALEGAEQGAHEP